MKRARLFACVLGAVAIFACDISRLLPDAGISCTTEYRYVPIQVVDGSGQPVKDATVTAKLGDGGTLTAQTDDTGTTAAIGESVGAGTIQVSASKLNQVSDEQSITWTCDVCHCNPQPTSVVLTLKP